MYMGFKIETAAPNAKNLGNTSMGTDVLFKTQ
eukprot:CAMPEP_0179467220 /NCGR_PEP_ID=MMETSP0799-20121207/48405_1 /TAXON_ID=46947 /ORGANISM="Geminigera cryophila, Strain CCMP2564" /LENGTH=31 /DNA_ID= /DNA_START= /DNA_END= /DNA_ORIENTATION=